MSSTNDQDSLHSFQADTLTLLSVTGAGLWKLDVENGEYSFDEQFAALTGHMTPALPEVYQSRRGVIHEDDWAEVAEHSRAVLAGEKSWSEVEYRLLCKGGKYKWVREKKAMMAEDGGTRALRAVGLVQDISSRRKTAAARFDDPDAKIASASGSLEGGDPERPDTTDYRSILFHGNPQVCILFNRDFRVVDCNEAAVRVFGFQTRRDFFDQFSDQINALICERRADGRKPLSLLKKLETAKDKGSMTFTAELDLNGGPKMFHAAVLRFSVGDTFFLGVFFSERGETEESLQVMMDAVPLACVLADDQFNAVDCNMEAVRLSGFENKAELLARYHEILPPLQPDGSASGEKLHLMRARTLKSGTVAFPFVYQLLNGECVPTEIIMQRVPWKDTFRIASYGRDLRELDAAIRKVIEAEEQAKRMLDETPLACCLWDESLQMVECNLEALRMFGVDDKEEFMRFFNTYSPEFQPDGTLSLPRKKELIAQGMQTSARLRFEWMHQRSDGEPLPTEITLKRISWRNSFHLLGYVRDLRELKLAEKAIERRERLLVATAEVARLLLQIDQSAFDETLHEAMLTMAEAVGSDRISIWRNVKSDEGRLMAVRIAGWIRGRPLHEERIGIRIDYADYLPEWEGKSFTGEDLCLTIREANENMRSYYILKQTKSLLLLPMFSTGKFWGFVGLSFETEGRQFSEMERNTLRSSAMMMVAGIMRNEITENLVEAKNQALASTYAKSEFLSRMSHEIRTPMNAIIGMTAVAKKTEDLARLRECLDRVDQSSHQLLSIINDILDMSKIEAGKFEIHKAEFDFESLLRRVVNVVQLKLDEKHQEFTLNFDRMFTRKMVSDELRLSQVLINLLTNAVKFTPDYGKVSLRISEKPLTLNESLLRIEVADTGIGLTEEQKERVFSPFEQADGGITRQFGGTGLGLAICKKIVTLMGGDIWVESASGQGAVFTFEVLVSWGAEQGRPEQLSGGAERKEFRILVVDDNQETLEYFRAILAEAGARCDTAAGGGEAVVKVGEALAGSAPYDIILLDWFMPGKNGGETAREIRRLARDQVIIIMTSVLGWGKIEPEMKEIDVTHYLPKPVFPSALFDTLARLVPHEDPPPGEDRAYNWPGKRILLVEDIVINRDIVTSLLEDTGITIDYAENGSVAVDMFVNGGVTYDLILMDIQMPVLDGVAATERIRQSSHPRAESVPIIALTANAFKEDILRYKKAGMNDHLTKPIEVEALFSLLSLFLDRPEAAPEKRP